MFNFLKHYMNKYKEKLYEYNHDHTIII